MKKVIKLILIVVAIIIIVILVELNLTTDCYVLKNRIDDALNKTNFCEKDIQCEVKLVNESVCPFGCFQLVNRDAKIKDLKNDLKSYSKKCADCAYECINLPEKQDLVCQNNKCVVGSKNVNS